jgi:formylglycine-generating enzyme required for sulfatase activity
MRRLTCCFFVSGIVACGSVAGVNGVSTDGGVDASVPADSGDLESGPPPEGGRDGGDATIEQDVPPYYDASVPGSDLEVPTGIVPGDPAPAGSVPSCPGYPGPFPAVTPGKSCPANVPAGQVCLEEGWVCTFHRDRNYAPPAGKPYTWDSKEEVATPPPACQLETSNVGSISPVFVRGFRMDIREFTNGDLMALLASLPPAEAAKVPVPPERTDDPEEKSAFCEASQLTPPPQKPRTGWFGRTFRPLAACGYNSPGIGYASPVVGLDRPSAEAICKARGGRLPRVDEFQRAARGLAPTARLFPWGDDIPTNATCPTGHASWSECAPLAVGGDPFDGVHRIASVTTQDSDRSPGGVRGILGGISEWTATGTNSGGTFAFQREPGIYTAPPISPVESPVATVELRSSSAAEAKAEGVRFLADPAHGVGARTLYLGFRCMFDL